MFDKQISNTADELKICKGCSFKDTLIGLVNINALKPYIIAEIASAHEGNLNLLRKLLNAAIKSQADAVKFQVFRLMNL